MAAPRKIVQQIRELLTNGVSFSQIARQLNCSRGTISYHAARLGIKRPHGPGAKIPKHNWKEIQQYYDNGHSFRDCAIKFGFAAQTWTKAVRAGRIVPRLGKKPIETFLIKNCSCSRSHLKTRLIEEGLLQNRCAICGLETNWQNKPLVLVLDHKNGKIMIIDWRIYAYYAQTVIAKQILLQVGTVVNILD